MTAESPAESPAESAADVAPVHRRRLTPPPRSAPLAWCSALVAAVVLLAMWATVAAGALPGPSVAALPIAVIAVAASVAVGRPAVQALAGSRQVGRLLDRDEVMPARRRADLSRRRSLTALGLAAATAVLTSGAFLLQVNDGSLRTTFLRWDLMGNGLGAILSAFWVNVVIALSAEVLILVWALVLAVARLLPGPAARPVRWIATAYVDLFRAIPIIVVIYLVGFGLPLTGLPLLSGLAPLWFAVLALTLSYGAYVSEIYRGGLLAIPPAQVAAARSLGLGAVATLRFVVLPQVFRDLVPALMSWFVALQKDTALVGIVGILDAFAQARFYSANDFNLSAVTAVSLVFVVITIPQTRFVDHLLARSHRRRRGA